MNEILKEILETLLQDEEFSEEYVDEVHSVYVKLVQIYKSDKAKEFAKNVLPFSNLFDLPIFKEVINEFSEFLFIGLLLTWRDMEKEEQEEFIKDLEDNENWDKEIDPEDEWKRYALALSSITLPGMGSGKIKFTTILEAIRKLEDEIGEIVFLSALQELEGEHRDKYLAYFFKRIITHEIKYALRDNLEVAMNQEVNLEQEGAHEFQEQLKTGPEVAIERYTNTYELILKNFVDPIFKVINNSGNIPPDIEEEWKNKFHPYRCPNHLRVKCVKEIIIRNPEYATLNIIFENINVRLRNSLIHESYYVRENIVHYYYKESGEIIFETISVGEIKELNAGNFFKLWIIPVVIALKIVEDEGILEDL